MEASYKVSALGIAPGHFENTVRDGLKDLLKGDPATFEPKFQRILLNQQVVLVKNLPEVAARNLYDKLTEIGFLCRIDPMALTLETKTYRCPACGHEQPHATDGTPDTCEKCHIIGDRYKGNQPNRRNRELHDAIELERRALAAQSTVADEKQTREAERKRNAKLRKIARRKVEQELGVTFFSKLRPYLAPRVLLPAVAGLALLGGSVGLVLWDQRLGDVGAVDTADAALPSGQPGGMQVVITPPPGLSVTVGADPALGGTADLSPDGVESALAGAGGTSPDRLSESAVASGVAASEIDASGMTGKPALKVDIPDLPASAKSFATNDPAFPTTASDPRVLASLAFYQLDTGDLGAATRTLDRATLAMNGAPDAARALPKDRLLRDAVALRAGLADQYAKQADLTSAQSQWRRANLLADSIPAADFRAMAYGSLGRASHENRELPAQKEYLGLAVETAAQSAGGSLERIDLLGTLARDFALIGQHERATAFFEKATTALSRIQDRAIQPVAQAILAQRLAEAGETETAAAMLGSSLPPSADEVAAPASARHPEALAALASSRARQGDITQAQTDFSAAIVQARSLTDPVARTESLVYLARAIFQAGDPAAAGQLVDSAGSWD
ncbi:hypothetical protein [Thiocystis violascens]|uniref:Tetratricopeptide repeat protein n=1 Tax=Thiocystis violascens (strain ATCC 17096 / DSM 198 / 6111) TaxID=765911 RepID=I3YBK6_THIV6|nr:hypothetical protein [Thiocystis violascens]AFL74374.1 hypothetical protein Thivi_2432 [Thiocystis violascens DSM 198]